MRKLFVCGAFALLVGCATTTPALSTFISAETLDTAALAGLLSYESLAKPNALIVAECKLLQAQVDAAFAPLETQAQAGVPIGDTTLAVAAVQALITYEQSNGITVTGSK